jgi:hypothetical protein
MGYVIFKIFSVGLGILLAAMVVNFLAKSTGLETWYSFIEQIQKSGLVNTLKSKWPHLIFLVFIYPFVLGLVGYFFFKLFE